jgi:hypothetical protein
METGSVGEDKIFDNGGAKNRAVLYLSGSGC